jgi:DNA repair protein RadC
MDRVRCQRAEIPLKLTGVDAARDFFVGCFAEQKPDQETLWVAHLDDESRCVHLSRHLGDASGGDITQREIVVDAARHGSASMLLAHNHPSGDPSPSDSDLRATKRLASVADAMECRLLDHFVFAGSHCTSMRRLGYL